MRLRLALLRAFGTPTNSVRPSPTTTDSLTLGERFLYPPTRCQSSCGKSVTPETCGVPFSHGFPVLPEPRGCARGRRRSPGWHLGQPKRSTTVRRSPAAAQPRRTLAGPPVWGARIRAPETRNPRNRWHGSRVVTPNGSGAALPARHVTSSRQDVKTFRATGRETCARTTSSRRGTRRRKEDIELKP